MLIADLKLDAFRAAAQVICSTLIVAGSSLLLLIIGKLSEPTGLGFLVPLARPTLAPFNGGNSKPAGKLQAPSLAASNLIPVA
jgi:hypothetical protein